MGSITPANGNVNRPHAVCIPYMAQGHITPMLKLAKLLHQKGFYITFVNSEYNHRRFLKSDGPAALDGLPDFCFETIPDGLPESDADATQDIPALSASVDVTCLEPFCELITKLNSSSSEPKVSCIVADGVMTLTLEAAERFGLPEVLFWTTSAIGFLAYTQYQHLLDRGYTPLKERPAFCGFPADAFNAWYLFLSCSLNGCFLHCMPLNSIVTCSSKQA